MSRFPDMPLLGVIVTFENYAKDIQRKKTPCFF